MEEERKAGESARQAKAEQHRAIQQNQKQAAQEVLDTVHLLNIQVYTRH